MAIADEVIVFDIFTLWQSLYIYMCIKMPHAPVVLDMGVPWGNQVRISTCMSHFVQVNLCHILSIAYVTHHCIAIEKETCSHKHMYLYKKLYTPRWLHYRIILLSLFISKEKKSRAKSIHLRIPLKYL